MPIIHLLRHGHVHNPQGILYGRLPGFRLSEAGEEMARVVAGHLRTNGHDIGRLVSSPLLRAQQTAEAIADAFGLKVETDERLIESQNSFEGEDVHPFAKYLLQPKRLWSLRNPFKPSWGEPYVEQRDRVMAAVMDAAQKEPNRESVLVSHQLPIWVTRLSVEGRRLAHDPRRRRCSLASLTSLSIEDGKVVRLDYSEPAVHVAVPR
ncbi:MAG: histidine phosphatase family protein [Demequinaceae bacterium]|nr:histidine phosphatase family protein [Demequinaceae bacterium]